APDPLDAGRGPFEVALWRTIGEQIKPRGVGAVAIDNIVEADNVLLRLAHLFVAAGDDRLSRSIDEAARGVGRDLFREQPLAGLVLIGLVADHALGEQTGERL